jgi:predicted Fe-Mo cluster-binding NifX family protein
MRKLRVAVPTKGEKGMQDQVSEVFGRAKTVTIIDTIDSEVRDVLVVKNPAASYRYGAGPILVKSLADMRVDVILAS